MGVPSALGPNRPEGQPDRDRTGQRKEDRGGGASGSKGVNRRGVSLIQADLSGQDRKIGAGQADDDRR